MHWCTRAHSAIAFPRDGREVKEHVPVPVLVSLAGVFIDLSAVHRLAGVGGERGDHTAALRALQPAHHASCHWPTTCPELRHAIVPLPLREALLRHRGRGSRFEPIISP